MMKTTAATTLSSTVVALALAAINADAEQSKAPTPTLHGLSNTVTNHETRIASLESEMKKVDFKGGHSVIQHTAYHAGQENSPRTYIIQTGDTVSEIARRHNVPRSSLMAANNLKEGQQIYIGDELIIPAGSGSAMQSDPTLAQNTPAPAPKAPPVTNAEPSPTKKPAPAPATAPSKPAPNGGPQFTTYTVKKGDSLSSIARRNKVSVDDIVRANKLNNANHISINHPLQIPVNGGSNSAAAPAAPAPQMAKNTPVDPTPAASEEEFGAYTIQKGDTLWSLSRDFFTTQQEIQQLNKMGRSTILRPGQELVVPTKKYFEYHNRLSAHSG